ncbi:nucleoside recognition domain-containing protein [Sphingobacterium spiritivorum]|uniref:Transporter gate domain protein n=2 Tax=Sphingobacterium spiritivorum TaxID=258 RepID=D7VQE0_SPHSI|nr:spore maturation protein [Sphingobacterium spiritivorum]EEI92901.1 transporter gate domain protein [Sphingobacterium spiritivorum ATCC 33300]EFK55991.1 transporter gate domain protein [Sphingobacterium spiritivorum ATCC 33861]QQS96256.1 spore maturation protein [Sphingobacterium spiritivorum]QQT35876.1 spore maturation protein [Sphingobacterium spiritivorum]WQD32603.1 nucleoside recognition domain-containing protein [Sphingobacterium spiritivorum]
MALNYVWIAFFIIAFIVALCRLLFLGDTEIFSQVINGMFDSAKTGAEISLGLVGMMTFWLGIMKVGEKAGMISLFAKGVNPFFSKLFPGVPKNHPANGSIIMNFSANMLGLDNAATPVGLKAMKELQELNPQKDTATNAQIMFLVLNTAGIALIPTSVIALRLANGAANPADIFIPSLIGTFISFIAGMISVAFFQKINLFKLPILIFLGIFAGLMTALYFGLNGLPPEQIEKITGLIGGLLIFSIIVLFIAYGAAKKINVYDAFIDGAKEGFQTSVMIIPFLIAILVAISAFRTTGCMDYIVNGIGSAFAAMGFDTRFVPALPVGLMKTLSGGGARGLMVDVMTTYGADSFQGRLASVIQGSSETTFYVLAVYFGSVGIKNTRHALTCGLIADAVGLIAAIIIAYIFFG